MEDQGAYYAKLTIIGRWKVEESKSQETFETLTFETCSALSRATISAPHIPLLLSLIC